MKEILAFLQPNLEWLFGGTSISALVLAYFEVKSRNGGEYLSILPVRNSNTDEKESLLAKNWRVPTIVLLAALAFYFFSNINFEGNSINSGGNSINIISEDSNVKVGRE